MGLCILSHIINKIFTGQAGDEFFAEIFPLIGEILRIKSVPIEFNIEGKKRRKIKIPVIVEMEIEGLTGSDQNVESKVVNPAFSNTPGYDPVMPAPSDIPTKITVWNGITSEECILL